LGSSKGSSISYLRKPCGLKRTVLFASISAFDETENLLALYRITFHSYSVSSADAGMTGKTRRRINIGMNNLLSIRLCQKRALI